MTDQRKKYLQEAYDDMQNAARGIDGMTSKQFEAINQAVYALNEALEYALECHDLRLSDVDRLQRAQFKLQHSINTEPNEYQIEGFREYGIGDYADDDDDDDDTSDE